MPTSPSDEVLKSAIIDLKSKNPTLGIAKVHALLQTTFPDWAVSEKRTRKVLQNEGLTLASGGEIAEGDTKVDIYPTSRLIPELDVSKWTAKVAVKYFNKIKGKGLVAVDNIKEGELIWKEDPFIIAPEWEIYDLQVSSAACSHCTTPLTADSPLILNCPSSSSASYCPARYCNRLCLSRSSRTHALLCPSQNPASVPLLKWARESKWMAIHALAQCTSRLLLTLNQQDPATFDAEWHVVKGLAELGMEERSKYSFKSRGLGEPDTAGWAKAYQLYLRAFQEPATLAEKKKLGRISKKPLSAEISKDLFEYDPGFLHGLGRMSLNLEAHGGLYTLHSHLNHSCTPNVSIRHFDQRTALSRITVVALKEIKAGEELVITYVNPELNVKARQLELEAWGFGTCQCARCKKEGKEYKGTTKEPSGMDDLASELKASLGVV